MTEYEMLEKTVNFCKYQYPDFSYWYMLTLFCNNDDDGCFSIAAKALYRDLELKQRKDGLDILIFAIISLFDFEGKLKKIHKYDKKKYIRLWEKNYIKYINGGR